MFPYILTLNRDLIHSTFPTGAANEILYFIADQGPSTELLSKLNDMVSRKMELLWISRSKEWPKTPRALSDRLNEVIPNLRDIGIIIHREYDKH